jgi:DNA-binding XRE family transcriptional regulator
VLKLAGYTNSQIASAIGISRGQVREILEKPEVTEKLSLRTRLPQAALDLDSGLDD